MNVGLRGLCEALEKILHQLDLKTPDAFCRDFRFHNAARPSAKIDRGSGKCFVHRHEEIASPQNAALGAKGLLHGCAESDADIFDGVMLIHIEIAASVDVQIEC